MVPGLTTAFPPSPALVAEDRGRGARGAQLARSPVDSAARTHPPASQGPGLRPGGPLTCSKSLSQPHTAPHNPSPLGPAMRSPTAAATMSQMQRQCSTESPWRHHTRMQQCHRERLLHTVAVPHTYAAPTPHVSLYTHFLPYPRGQGTTVSPCVLHSPVSHHPPPPTSLSPSA